MTIFYTMYEYSGLSIFDLYTLTLSLNQNKIPKVCPTVDDRMHSFNVTCCLLFAFRRKVRDWFLKTIAGVTVHLSYNFLLYTFAFVKAARNSIIIISFQFNQPRHYFIVLSYKSLERNEWIELFFEYNRNDIIYKDGDDSVEVTIQTRRKVEIEEKEEQQT